MYDREVLKGIGNIDSISKKPMMDWSQLIFYLLLDSIKIEMYLKLKFLLIKVLNYFQTN